MEQVNKIDFDRNEFMLKCCDNHALDKVLELYNNIKELQFSWGNKDDLPVEASIKIGSNRLSCNRYSFPIIGVPFVTLDMIKSVMKILDAPLDLYNIISEKHSKKIRMLVGIDFDNNGKRLYFNAGEQAYGYEFRDSASSYINKNYKLVQKHDYCNVMDNLKQLTFTNSQIKNILKIIPVNEWKQVCERTNSGIHSGSLLGYHVSSIHKPKISDIKSYINEIISEMNSIECSRADSWLDRNNNSYLYWLGLGTDKKKKPEITFYLRPCIESWDDKYAPKDFFSIFSMKIMNQ